MSVDMISMARSDKQKELSFARSAAVAQSLLAHLNESLVLERLRLANTPRASSSLVQNVFLDFARDLGFRDESKGLFGDYKTSGLRPDYFLEIGGTGILLEVERGKTTINNMDLLDFWKCHLCSRANYLFLMVPKELRQNGDMAPRREFAAVQRRLSAFFVPRNYTNVWGLWLFGY